MLKTDLEKRVETLEGLVKGFSQYADMLTIMERRRAKVIDIGMNAEQLRALVDYAVEIAAREEAADED